MAEPLRACPACGAKEFGVTWRGGTRGTLYACGSWLGEDAGDLKESTGRGCLTNQLAAAKTRIGELHAAERRVQFLDNPGTEADGYDCDHERRYLLDRTDGEGDGYDDCQLCRAEQAEEIAAKWQRAAERLARMLTRARYHLPPHEGEIANAMDTALAEYQKTKENP